VAGPQTPLSENGVAPAAYGGRPHGDYFAVVPERISDAGETVVSEGRYRGTVKATGKAVSVQFAHVWRFRDGKVISHQQYTDTQQWAAAFGA
jgi:ketosteroid isomerase-like protein